MDDTSPARTKTQIWLPRIAILIALTAGLYFAGKLGLHWRRWTWDTTASIRFMSDIDRNYDWGRKCATEGYLNQYEKMQLQKDGDANWLDYAPLRLGVMALWGKWSLTPFPKVNAWHDDRSYALTAPVLYFNLAMESVGLISAFLLTRLWVIRRSPPPPSDSLQYFFRGWIPGLIAALLLWFNPALVLSAYGWPTWDLWIIPIFLLAALLASVDWWFAAGIVLGIGAMFKGQQLVAMPVFVIWALVQGQPQRALRLCGGVVTVIALIASPWLITYIPSDQLSAARAIQEAAGQAYRVRAGTFHLARVLDVPALIWIIGVMIAAAGMPWIGWLRLEKKSGDGVPLWRRLLESPWAWRFIAAMGVIILVGWPWLLKQNHDDGQIIMPAVGALVLAMLFIRPRGIAFVTATATGVALLMCMPLFHGSSGWYDCGIQFGTIHRQRMSQGSTDNLPAILTDDFGWDQEDIQQTALTLPANFLLHYPKTPLNLSIKQVLLVPFVVTLILSAIGVGMQSRRRDSRILIALAAPWLMFFCFPAQIHARYLLYGAAISCVCAGVSTGMTLLGIFLSLVTCLMTYHLMLAAAAGRGGVREFGKVMAKEFPSLFNDDAGAKLLSIANGSHPDLGYAVILCALIFLYFSLALRRRV